MNNIKTAQAIANRIAKGDRDFGRVYIKEDGPYFLLNYTPEAMYGGDMTDVEKTCRGLVVRDDGRIMALPMPKFFNLGEPQCPALPNEGYDIWEKIDGSLGLFWHDGRRWRTNTRGSFCSEYTDFAAWWWDRAVDAEAIPRHLTVMVEICFDNDPESRAVHHAPGLYLVAVRDKYSGKDLNLADIFWYKLHFWYPRMVAAKTILALHDDRNSAEGTEGWVIRYESGLRVKIKTAWYLRMFRAIRALTPNNIRQLMIDAGQDWIDEFPDDLRPEAVAIQEEIEERYRSTLAHIYDAYSRVAGIEPRKEYALTILNDYPAIAHWLFALRDGKFDELEVLHKLEV